ncbi:MAG: DUF1730 domain-containing protein [Defluviitaleaceae bacterium]|nr:DUF1730 domain-containing protein [Defluviitaleaceae bacterium]
MTEILEKFAQENNIIAGICDAAPLDDSARSASPKFVPFVSTNAEKRTNPAATLPGVQSIIVVGVGYATKPLCRVESNSPERSAESSNADVLHSPCFENRHNSTECSDSPGVTAHFSRSSIPDLPGFATLSSLGTVPDYHPRVKEILRRLVRELQDAFGRFPYKILVDSPGLDERALAFRAGPGFFGRNGLLISEKFGSNFNIGCLLTARPASAEHRVQISTHVRNAHEIAVVDSRPVSSRLPVVDGLASCDNAEIRPREKSHRMQVFGTQILGCPPDCNRCINACPNNALGGESLRAERCISYLTQKDELSPEEAGMLHGQLFGCDICRDVCPFNAHMPRLSQRVDPREWLAMSDSDFEKKYGRTGILWRGTNILRRNAAFASMLG